jgi:hypothetical protein
MSLKGDAHPRPASPPDGGIGRRAPPRRRARQLRGLRPLWEG